MAESDVCLMTEAWIRLEDRETKKQMMSKSKETSILKVMQKHMDWFLENGTIQGYGPDDNGMWMSSLDLNTSCHPVSWDRPEGIEKRCYRWIESPGGSNAYWDGPLMVAGHALSRLTGCSQYGEAVDQYVTDFLDRCAASNGLFLWGNHYFYEMARGCTVWFGGGDKPPEVVDFETENGWLHETRPLPVAWDLFWRIDPEATERAIRAQGAFHVVDRGTGEHNRHADQTRGHAFLESGGILAETLCYLAKQVGDESLADLALKIAVYNFDHRNRDTGLLSNSPTKNRWDMHMNTSETGMWASSLLRCFDLSGDQAFADMAVEALGDWLNHAWCEDENQFYGKLWIKDATPVMEPKTTLYQPGNFCDVWEPLFPAHDYPMPNAEACLECYRHTGEDRFLEGVERWVRVVENSLPARGGSGGYAEHYGRVIHFLLRASDVCECSGWKDLAHRIAVEAFDVLAKDDKFRTHPGEERCDAVDGLGFLFLALMYLETGVEPDLMGMGF